MVSQNVCNFRVLLWLMVFVQLRYGIASQEDMMKKCEMIIGENAGLRDRFEMVIRENADLRNRITALEQGFSDHLIKRGRRQSMATRVAFSAYLDHRLTSFGMGQPITFNRILTNEGNGYNGSSGIFVAPVSGLYLFSWASTARRLPDESAYDEWIDPIVNGVHMLSTVAESRDEFDDNQGSNTVVLRVSRGQHVWIAHSNDRGELHGNDKERSSSFTGVLLYDYE